MSKILIQLSNQRFIKPLIIKESVSRRNEQICVCSAYRFLNGTYSSTTEAISLQRKQSWENSVKSTMNIALHSKENYYLTGFATL